MLAYLSGAIEHAPDGGKRWRREITPFLQSELGHEVYDPTQQSWNQLTPEEKAHFRRWKTSDLGRFQQVVRRIIAHDLAQLEQADYVICLWDEHARHGGGTHGELTLAHRWGKPVYLVPAMPLAEISGWIIGCATEILDDFELLKQRLLQIYKPDRSMPQ